MARVLALDYGQRRTGYALSDPLARLAGRDGFLETTGRRALVAAVVEMCRAEGVGELVIGNPLQMNGVAGDMAIEVDGFITALKKKCPLPIQRWDERFTSLEAGRVMAETQTRKKQRQFNSDRIAAALILEGFLEMRRMAAPGSEPGATGTP